MTTTSNLLNDPVGQAILDFSTTQAATEIIVSSDICEDDIIPVPYLFRKYDSMPELEKQALKRCKGRILDVGAAAGTHAKYLIEKGFDVTCIDISKGSVDYLKSEGLNAEQADFYRFSTHQKFDTLLFMMNGIGISGTLDKLEQTLFHAKTLLNENGKILFDSSDIKYLFMDDEGGMWVDLNAEYYGHFNFQMKYKQHTSDWFKWLYVDFNTIKSVTDKMGMSIGLIHEEDSQYLAEITF